MIGITPFVIGILLFVIGITPFVIGILLFVIGITPFVIGILLFVIGITPFVIGIGIPAAIRPVPLLRLKLFIEAAKI
ncbi:hypothetical protein [Planococcus beigongshangi]|uniref:hypothetical protein n=1 Tax=Planococcus beigongshangi TaxID=2782536 RepID=UPI00193B3A94|nr:hypothetical protein [Planococcus beigongshangi]